MSAVAGHVGAVEGGVAGQDAVAADISTASTHDLWGILPVVLAALALLLAALLRSLVAPLYLIVTVALSYVAALGFATLVFVHLGGGSVRKMLLCLRFCVSVTDRHERRTRLR